MRELGIHLRVYSTLANVAEYAHQLGISTFQAFGINQTTRKLISYDRDDCKNFVRVRRAHFGSLYIHASYWTNLSSVSKPNYKIIEHELHLAQRYEFTHIVIHPGHATGAIDRLEGIDALVRALNYLIKKYSNIYFVLENTCHGIHAIGSDLQDFFLIKSKLDSPERVVFCLDTAHAFVYGYDFVSENAQKEFIQLLDQTMSIDRIALIHLNDSHYGHGLKKDRHEIPGNGQIGYSALNSFAMDSQLYRIPIIVEPPELPEQELISVKKMLDKWKI
ncbi:deoxyribonuclease IV [Vermiphilus pyriformis]|nr:MAG: deoxyribonuclease IV [Vermiphilus pyriformis]